MKGRILTSLLAVMAMASLQAQEVPAVPRLVVGLTIDQLRMDYIEAFSALYGERGFKRLWKEGRIYRNAEFDFVNVDKVFFRYTQHHSTLVGYELYKPLAVQALERLAYGRAAYSELARKLHFRNGFAGAKLLGNNLFFKRKVNFIFKGSASVRLKHGFSPLLFVFKILFGEIHYFIKCNFF